MPANQRMGQMAQTASELADSQSDSDGIDQLMGEHEGGKIGPAASEALKPGSHIGQSQQDGELIPQGTSGAGSGGGGGGGGSGNPKVKEIKEKLAKVGIKIAIYLGATVVFGAIMCGVIIGYSIANKYHSPTGQQCYYAKTNPNQVTNAVYLNANGYDVVGPYPTSTAEVGQTTQWFDTGLQTNGDILQVRVNNNWYPWGETGTASSLKTVAWNSTDGYIIDNTSGTGNVKGYYTLPQYNQCSFSTDLQYISTTDPNQIPRQQNQIMRYGGTSSSPVSIEDQIEYIQGVQCLQLGGESGEECLQFAPSTYNQYSTCAMGHGHGVYMKIGDLTNYAWHLANYEIVPYVYGEKNGVNQSYPLIDPSTNLPEAYYVPFTLPTMIRNPNYPAAGIPNITTVDPTLIDASAANTTTSQLAAQYECSLSESSFQTLINENCPPPAGQEIYLAVDDIYYKDNTGILEVIFDSGAQTATPQQYNGTTTGPSYSFMQTIVARILQPLFGPQDFNTMPIGALIDFTNDDQGMVIYIRNGLLSNFLFQTMRALSMMIMITLYGWGVITGKTNLSAKDFAKKITTIGIAFWGTDPSNYTLIDDVIVPILYTGIPAFGGILMEVAASISGLSITVNNPWQGFDVLLQMLYGPVIGYRMMAYFTGDIMFWLTGLILFYTMLKFTLAMFKIFAETLIGVIVSAMSISILPILFLLMLNDHTSQYMKKWFNTMVSTMLQTMLFLFVMMIFFSFAAIGFQKIFNFTTCWTSVIHIGFGLIMHLNIWGWGGEVPGFLPYTAGLIWFMIGTHFSDKTPKIAMQIAALFGAAGGGFKQSGADILSGLGRSAVDAASHIPLPGDTLGAVGKAAGYAKDTLQTLYTGKDKSGKDVSMADQIFEMTQNGGKAASELYKSLMGENGATGSGSDLAKSMGYGDMTNKQVSEMIKGMASSGGGIGKYTKGMEEVVSGGDGRSGIQKAMDFVRGVSGAEGADGLDGSALGSAAQEMTPREPRWRGVEDGDSAAAGNAGSGEEGGSVGSHKYSPSYKLPADMTEQMTPQDVSEIVDMIVRIQKTNITIERGGGGPEQHLSLDNDSPPDPTTLTSGIENSTITGLEFSSDNELSKGVTGDSNVLASGSITNPPQPEEPEVDEEAIKQEEAKAHVEKKKTDAARMAINELVMRAEETIDIMNGLEFGSEKHQEHLQNLIATAADLQELATENKVRTKELNLDEVEDQDEFDDASKSFSNQATLMSGILSKRGMKTQ